MGEIIEIYLNDLNYASTSFQSDWLEVSSLTYLIFSAYSSGSGFTMSIEYSVDKNYQVINTDTETAVAGTLSTLNSKVVCKYARFKITGFTSGQDLKLQAFLASDLSFTQLKNIGTGAKIFVPTDNAIKTLKCTDGSVLLAQYPEYIDLTEAGGNINLSSAGAGISLVNDGSYPSLAVKSVYAGTGISIPSGPDDITITNTAEIQNIGDGTINLVKEGLPPTYEIHRLKQGGGISLTYDPSDGVVISSTAVGSITTTYPKDLVITNDGLGNYTANVGTGHGTGRIGIIASSTGTIGNGSTALGLINNCSNSFAIAIGSDAQTFSDGSVAIGPTTRSRTSATAIGYRSEACNNSVSLGYSAGESTNGTANNCTYIGYRAGKNSSGSGNTCVGYNQFQYGAPGGASSSNNTCIGANQATPYTYNNTVMLGYGCASPAVNGRLAFGNAMETPHGSFAMPNAGVPEAYLKIAWNGVLYYIPAFTTIPT